MSYVHREQEYRSIAARWNKENETVQGVIHTTQLLFSVSKTHEFNYLFKSGSVFEEMH
jgi:hypothetical protein